MKKLALLLQLLPILAFSAKAPDFTVIDYKNRTHKLYENYLNNEKVVVLKLFFVDCPPCNAIAPQFQSAYVKWGAGSGRVQFIELSTMSFDNNSYVKTYADKHGLTCPSVGSDGGSLTAVAPYRDNKTFGPWYGTPTFVVIAPNGEVNYGVQFSKSNTVSLDSAIAQALRIPSGGSGGGNKCNDSFDVKVYNPINNYKLVTYDRFSSNNPKYDILNNKYNCEFFFPALKDNYVVGIEAATESGDYLQGVSTQDIVILQKFILRINPINNLQYVLSDVNGNGTVSVSDISEIRKLILGSTEKFKIEKNVGWAYNPKGFDNQGQTFVSVNKLITDSNNEFAFGRFGDLSGAANINFTSTQSRSTSYKEIIIQISKEASGNYLYELIAGEDINFVGFQFMLSGKSNTYYNLSFNRKIEGIGAVDANLSDNLNNNTRIRIAYVHPTNKEINLNTNEVLCSFKANQFVDLNPFFTQELIDKDGDVFDINYKTKLKSNNLIDFIQQENQVFINSKEIIDETQIFDITSGLLKSQKNNQNTATISLEEFKPGIYMVKARLLNGQTETKKIFIIR